MTNTDPSTAQNERAFRETISTVSTLTVVCVVLLIALYNLRDTQGTPTSADNLIATLAYIAMFVLPFLVAGFLANVIVLIWCWPTLTPTGERLYIDAAKVRSRRWFAYGVLIVLALTVAGFEYLHVWQSAMAAMR